MYIPFLSRRRSKCRLRWVPCYRLARSRMKNRWRCIWESPAMIKEENVKKNNKSGEFISLLKKLLLVMNFVSSINLPIDFQTLQCMLIIIQISYVCLGGCTITSKTKINVFWKIFFTPGNPSGTLNSKKFLVLEANNALSCPNGLFSTFQLLVLCRSPAISLFFGF